MKDIKIVCRIGEFWVVWVLGVLYVIWFLRDLEAKEILGVERHIWILGILWAIGMVWTIGAIWIEQANKCSKD